VKKKLEEEPQDWIHLLSVTAPSQGVSDSEDAGNSEDESLDQPESRPTRSLESCSFEELRKEIWLLKREIKLWMPLDGPLENHFLRTSLFWTQLLSSTRAIPLLPKDSNLGDWGFTKKEKAFPLSKKNISFDWGQGGCE